MWNSTIGFRFYLKQIFNLIGYNKIPFEKLPNFNQYGLKMNFGGCSEMILNTLCGIIEIELQ